MKHYQVDDDSFAAPAEAMNLPQLVHAHGMAYLFFYNVYNVPVQYLQTTPPEEIEAKSLRRMVIVDEAIHSMSGIATLWEDVVEEAHFYDKLYVQMYGFGSISIVPCTNCGAIDAYLMMEECKLCNAPLCKSCHKEQEYCSSHLN